MMTRRNFIILTLIILVVTVLFCLASFTTIQRNINYDPSALDRKISDIIANRLPVQVSDVKHEVLSAFQSIRIYLRFTLPSEYTDEFRHKFCSKMELTDNGYNTLNNVDDIDWWRPQSAKVYSVGNCYEGSTEFTILIDKTDSTQYIVYVNW